MLWFSGEAKEGSEEFAVSLKNIELGVKSDTQAVVEVEFSFGEGGSDPGGVFGLNFVVIGLDDGFFAGEVVVSGSEGQVSCGGDFAHGGRFQAALAEDAECSVKDVRASLMAFGTGEFLFEHVQGIGEEGSIVKSYLNMFE